MYISEELVFLQLQKSASTHIAAILENIFNGKCLGEEKKHYPPSADIIASNRKFLVSVRNPWDWHLSAWTYGCQNGWWLSQSQVSKRYSRISKQHFRNLKKTLHSLRQPHKIILEYLKELKRDTSIWKEIYSDSANINNFRTWVRTMNNPDYCKTIDYYKYNKSNITDLCGLYTYLYLRLCCKNPKVLRRQPPSKIETIKQFDKENCYIDYFIFQENLEETLCEALSQIRPLTDEEHDLIYSHKKTNTSKRHHKITQYYDDETRQIIADREKFMIEKFNYTFPEASSKN